MLKALLLPVVVVFAWIAVSCLAEIDDNDATVADGAKPATLMCVDEHDACRPGRVER